MKMTVPTLFYVELNAAGMQRMPKMGFSGNLSFSLSHFEVFTCLH